MNWYIYLILAIIFLIVPLYGGLIVLLVNRRKIKGYLGEHNISSLLEKIVKKENGYLINNVIVPGCNGKTSQIDHILFLNKGIFVIETKNYGGTIYGNDDDSKWTQVLNYGKVKNTFYNPVKQNKTHLYNLRNLLNNSKLISLVVFPRADLSNVSSNYTYSKKGLELFINEFPKGNNVLNLNECYRIIKDYKENPIETNKQHIQNIKKSKLNIDRGICPRCGGNLILRHNKNGIAFYGCSNYPKCKFIKRDLD